MVDIPLIGLLEIFLDLVHYDVYIEQPQDPGEADQLDYVKELFTILV